jgi:hypothetical protein
MGGQQIFENGNGDEGGEYRDMQGPNATEAAHDELLASSADLSLSPEACAMTSRLGRRRNQRSGSCDG